MSTRQNIRSDTPPRTLQTDRLPKSEQDGFRAPPSDRDHAERAILVSILLPRTRVDLRNPLGELSALAQSAGVEVVDGLIQKRLKLTTNTALGKGKLQELCMLVEQHEVDVVLIDNDLLPRQIRGIENAVRCKVLDRSELILDIFASRAKSRQAQLQVELAQLEYTAPRLRGMWTHLERIAGAGGATGAGMVGGVGTRGPGERQIEIERRIVRKRISVLKREIIEIDKRRQREVDARSEQFTVSLVGYTNSGKSTLMNRLTDAGRYVADQLFATLDTKTARWSLGDGRTVLLSDTVGFVRDIPHHLVASFRATLEEALNAQLLLHVVDASAPEAIAQLETVERVLTELGCADLPRITLLNKTDIADHGALAELLARRGVELFPISALTGDGIDVVARDVIRRMQGHTLDVSISVPHDAGKLLTELDALADVRKREYLNDGVHLDLSISRSVLQQLIGRYGDAIRLDHDLPELADDAETP